MVAYLQVHLWVPVAVIQDDNISCSQVDTQTSSSGGQEEYKPAQHQKGKMEVQLSITPYKATTETSTTNAMTGGNLTSM
jgi:hypothetical protein